MVTETGSTLVVVEATLPAHGALTLALPAGRYLVHLRRENAVDIAEARLPWGGSVQLTDDDFVAHSYQAVAQKGGIVEIQRHRLRAGCGAQTGMLSGMGVLGVGIIGYGYDVAPFELGARLSVGQKTFDAADTTIKTRILGGGLTLAYEHPWAALDLRTWIFSETQLWHQRVRKEGPGFGYRSGALVCRGVARRGRLSHRRREPRLQRAAHGGSLPIDGHGALTAATTPATPTHRDRSSLVHLGPGSCRRP